MLFQRRFTVPLAFLFASLIFVKALVALFVYADVFALGRSDVFVRSGLLASLPAILAQALELVVAFALALGAYHAHRTTLRVAACMGVFANVLELVALPSSSALLGPALVAVILVYDVVAIGGWTTLFVLAERPFRTRKP